VKSADYGATCISGFLKAYSLFSLRSWTSKNGGGQHESLFDPFRLSPRVIDSPRVLGFVLTWRVIGETAVCHRRNSRVDCSGPGNHHLT
jgi:hypothetical protein